MKQKNTKSIRPLVLSPRLEKIAALVREGSFLLDVGSDHAYLPIALTERGRVFRAMATDLNEGPIARAAEHIAERGFSQSVAVRRRDGLQGAEADLPPEIPSDIVIAGMGGELIASILNAAPFLKETNRDISLILQPNTRSEALRRYLAAEGFAVSFECLVEEMFGSRRRLYPILVAAYRGTPYTLSLLEEYFGRENLRRGDALCLKNLRLASQQLQDVLECRRDMAREKTPAEKADEAMLTEIEAYLRKHETKETAT